MRCDIFDALQGDFFLANINNMALHLLKTQEMKGILLNLMDWGKRVCAIFESLRKVCNEST